MCCFYFVFYFLYSVPLACSPSSVESYLIVFLSNSYTYAVMPPVSLTWPHWVTLMNALVRHGESWDSCAYNSCHVQYIGQVTDCVHSLLVQLDYHSSIIGHLIPLQNLKTISTECVDLNLLRPRRGDGKKDFYLLDDRSLFQSKSLLVNWTIVLQKPVRVW